MDIFNDTEDKATLERVANNQKQLELAKRVIKNEADMSPVCHQMKS